LGDSQPTIIIVKSSRTRTVFGFASQKVRVLAVDRMKMIANQHQVIVTGLPVRKVMVHQRSGGWHDQTYQ
jgi:hypothetical protein